MPLDVEAEEIHEFFKKCGKISKDVVTGDPKIKLYVDKETGEQKGDARICYENCESVPLAIDILDQQDIRPGFKIQVQEATFQQKGDSYKPREVKRLDKIDKI